MSAWREMRLGLQAGMRLGKQRVLSRVGLWFFLLGLTVVVCVALLERNGGAVIGANRTLHVVFSLVLPVMSVLPIALVVRRSRLSDAVWCIARYGVSRRQLAWGLYLLASMVAAFAMLIAVAVSLAIVYQGQIGFWSDLLTTAWIVVLGAATYVAWFSVGARWFRYGWGLPLVLDYILGSGNGALAVLWPRAHLRNLLGGEVVMGMSQIASSASLALMMLVLLLMMGMQMPERGGWFRAASRT